MRTNEDPSSSEAKTSDSTAVVQDQIKEGDVRLINGVASLVLMPWMKDDETGEVFYWLVCPVKPVTGDDDVEPTGRCCFVQAMHEGTEEERLRSIFNPDPDDPTQGCGYALAEAAASMTPKFLGKLLYKVLPEQRLNAARCWYSQIGEPKGPYNWDFENPTSKDDILLINQMCRPQDIEMMMDDEAEAAEEERKAKAKTKAKTKKKKADRRTFNEMDKFGSMCGGCPYEDSIYKPCAECYGP